MPRLTTLTESIIGTAEDIMAGGEKVFFSNYISNKILEFKNQPNGVDQ